MTRNVSKIELIILILVLVISVTLGVIYIDKVDAIDVKILTFVRTNFDYSILKDIMYIISLILSPIPMAIIFIIISLLAKDKSVSIHIFINTAIAFLLNFALKHIFQRERPIDFFLIDESGYSFPSAHSMIGVAFYGTMLYCTRKYIYNKKVSIPVSILVWLVMVLTPISRVYLGVHNFTDVIIGAYIGAIIVRVSIFVINKIEKKEELTRLNAAEEK